mmetsp:Transcript_27349/g.68229  ORF Transcript_27349/g.68229 Transcript_27349/m.68229 type:complete len:201 (+) Transcript_27349:1528-2130(+)
MGPGSAPPTSKRHFTSTTGTPPPLSSAASQSTPSSRSSRTPTNAHPTSCPWDFPCMAAVGTACPQGPTMTACTSRPQERPARPTAAQSHGLPAARGVSRRERRLSWATCQCGTSSTTMRTRTASKSTTTKPHRLHTSTTPTRRFGLATMTKRPFLLRCIWRTLIRWAACLCGSSTTTGTLTSGTKCTDSWSPRTRKVHLP